MSLEKMLPIQPDLVVTKYRSLVEAARLCGLAEDVPVRTGVKPTDVVGKVVLGSLPLRLMASAKAVITGDLRLTAHNALNAMSGEELLQCLVRWRVYVVREASDSVLHTLRAASSRPLPETLRSSAFAPGMPGLPRLSPEQIRRRLRIAPRSDDRTAILQEPLADQ